jgi:hypothetical protein
MSKVFYTEIDIEDMVKRGVLSLEINDNVALTDLAYEKANRLGLKLVRDKPDNPPAAPVRPYLSQKSIQNQSEIAPVAIPVRPYLSQQRAEKHPEGAPVVATPRAAESDLQQRIRSAVLTRMGNQIDPALLDAIIQRVLTSTGIK